MPLDDKRPFIPVTFAVITVSDTRKLEDDRSGQTLVDRIEHAGHQLAAREIVKDDPTSIAQAVKSLAARNDIDAIITTGGTGFTGRDVTPDTLEPLFDKKMDGFSVLFHHISMAKISTSTIQSRATAGLIDQCFVFCIPGSPGACKDAWDGILAHQFDYRHMPCNFVEIMPRLDEHLKRSGSKSV